MKKSKKIILISILSFVFMLFITIGVFAYYEYYGQYASILNIDGTIKLDAFDVLYPELREDLDSHSDKTYGCTPENPYVIDNVLRLKNLIRLNNSGKLQRSKEKDGVDKYYFCLQFDEEELPQVLNLMNEGTFQSIGNNEYPFVDELSGIVYSYNNSYYSGCLLEIKTYTLTSPVSQSSATYNSGATYYKLLTGSDYEKVIIANEEEFNTNKASLYTTTSATKSETYIKVPTYDSNHQISAYSYVGKTTFNQNYTKIHQIIANETIEADDTQLDIGFISRIGQSGYVHDIILYNISVNCVEETPNSVFDVIKNILIGTNSHSKVSEDATNGAHERHIGIFAGHIDGAASNISIAGTTNIKIQTPKVNYYSNYTTVGHIDGTAVINGRTMAELETDSFLDGGSVSGCLFADNIYHAVLDQEKTENSTNAVSGAKYYKLKEIQDSPENGWTALVGNQFSYGAFTFMISDTNDTLSTIWRDSDKTKTLLGLNDSQYSSYLINQSVLYCSDEYRFSEDATSGGSIIRSSASVAQGLYAGVRPLDDGGSVVDAGKYLIVAKVVDGSRTGGYAYYALKLTINGNGDNEFDTSDAIDITNYIIDTTGNEKVYQSCVWDVPASTSTPIFKNNRWEDNYLEVNGSRTALTLIETSSGASSFQVNMKEDKFYYAYNDGTTNTVYYLNFNPLDKTFSLSTDSESTIQLYRISNGFNLEQVSGASDIMEAGDYVIVAKDATNSYLLGIEYSVNSETHEMQITNELATPKTYLNTSFPTSVTLSEYNEMINYIWYTNDLSSTGITSFKDKTSMTYFIGRNTNALSLSTIETYWTYNGTSSGTLTNGGYYINYSSGQFGLSNSQYTLYLYRLVPQDETPLYISYDGAKHLEAASTELKAGEYVIVANDNGTRYPLGLSNQSTINNSISSVTIGDYSPSNSFLWTISTDTYNPRFLNKQYTSYNLYTNGATLSSSTTEYTWFYDAIESRLYTVVEGNNKYLSYDSTNGFIISSVAPSIKIELYKNEIQHDISDITLLTSTATDVKNSFQNTTSSNRWYFISYYDITNTNYAPVLVEWNDKDPLDHRTRRSDTINYDRQWNGSSDNYVMNQNPYSTYNYTTYTMLTSQPNNWTNNNSYRNYYRITATANTNPNWSSNTYYSYSNNIYTQLVFKPLNWDSNYSNYYTVTVTQRTDRYDTYYNNTFCTVSSSTGGSFSTTDGNLLKALWGFETERFQPYQYSSTYNNTFLYNKYFQDNYERLGYTTPTSNYSQTTNRTWYHLGGYQLGKLYLAADDGQDSRDKAVTTSQSVRIIPNYNSGFASTLSTGANRVFIRFMASTGPVYYPLITKSSDGVLSFATQNNSSTSLTNIPYIYSCEYSTSYVLTLISSNGDNLDNTINYVITAKSNDKYYGLSYDSENASDGFTGYDVTTYINPIMNATGEVIKETVNVPKNSDWTCVANNSENMFYQTAISTNNTRYYLDSSGSTLTETTISTGGSTANILKLYYDTINKVMKCIKSSTTYYLTYNSANNKFGLSTNSANAAEIHLFRYDASYSVNIITDFDNVLMDGDFMIAAHSVDGWQAIGSNGSSAIQTDVTNMLTDTISEADYKSLLDYIYHQYEYTSESTFNSNVNSEYFIFKNFNLSETGSIAYKGNTSTDTYLLVGDAAPYEWKVSRFNDGTWKLINNQAIGNGDSEGQAAMNFTTSSTSSSLTISQSYKSITNYLTISGISTGSPVAIFNYSNGQLGELVRADTTGFISFTTNNQYVIAIMNSSKTYSLIGYSGNAIYTPSIGKNLNRATIEGLVNGNNTFVLTADSTGSYGHSLKFVANSNYYLNSGSNIPTASTTKHYFEYSYNHVYTEQSRLCRVESATASGNLDIRGNQIVSGGTSTYLFDHTTGKIATGTSLTNGTYYSILIFKDHKYYVVSLNNADNVVPVTYGSGLPSTFENNEKWLYNGSNFTMNGMYLGMGTDGGLDLFDAAPSITWSYSGSVSNTAGKFSNTYYTGSSVGLDNNYGICLFHIRKSDALSETADVESSLNYKAEVISSLSIMDSENYIIVAESNGRYYALTMMTKDSPTTIDITDEFSDALNMGYNISIYDASVWEQLGKDYSLVFANQGFANKYIKNEENYDFNTAVYDLYEATYENDRWNRGALVTNPTPMGNYIIIKEEGGNYSTCLMGNKGEWELNDTYENNLPTTVSKLEVYTYYETVNGNYVLTPYDAIIYLDDKYLLDGDITKRALNGGPTTTLFEELPDEMEDYTWTVYTYGTNQYVLGNYDAARGLTSYLYFDNSTYSFQFTTDIEEAKTLNKKVQVYRLGEKQENDTNYQTFEIAMNEDGFTIDSLPLTEVEDAEEIKAFSNSPASGAISSKIDGEYVIMAKSGNNYYALTTDADGNVKLADLSLMFSGNFLIDTNGNYCLSINTKYIWKQTNTPTVNGNIISNLNLQNYVYTSVGAITNNALTFNLNNVTYDLGNHRLYSGSTHLCYSRANGFTLQNSYGSDAIYIYSLGTDGIAVDENSDIMQYTYYSFALNTSAVDYSYFKFNKMLIPNLPNIQLDGENVLVSSRGWKKDSTSIIEEVNSSVYFKEGINYNGSQMTTEQFAANFEQVSYDYTLEDESKSERSISYYAPKGATSIVVTDASPEKPVFVNVIVSTELYKEQNGRFDETALRYLCLWKIADLDAETPTIQTKFDYSDGQTNSVNDYAYSLSQKFYTPYAAIPLPNCYSTATKQSSYVKVLNADGSDTEVYYLKYINYEHLLAHTYTISTPGIYYLGSTYGTVTFCYVSIDKMMAAEDAEDNSTTISEDFSIDFVWGTMGQTSTFDNDLAVGSIAYVGRTVQADASQTWVHSNIYPKFTNGNSTNPTDYLELEISRSFAVVDTKNVSTVHIDATTNTAVYNNGTGIMYRNSNSTGQRAVRKVEFNITLDEVIDASEPIIVTKNVVSFGELAANSIQTVYYRGTQEDWTNIENNTAVTNVYYYSLYAPESNPTSYWYYDDSGNPQIWPSS